jgi:hypothetical protein
VGILLTSFFFGVIHLHPAQGIMAFLMGLCLHFAYLMTRSLWVPISLHFLNNSLSVLIGNKSFADLISGDWIFTPVKEVLSPLIDVLNSFDKHPDQVPFLYVGALVLVAAIGYALYQSRAVLMSKVPGGLAWQPDYPGVEYPPPDSGTIVFHPKLGLVTTLVVLAGMGVFAKTCMMAVDILEELPVEQSRLSAPNQTAMVR